MILSINPSYYCNLNCDFCYLTKEQLADRHVLDFDQLCLLIAEADGRYGVDCVSIYGGEPLLLPAGYVSKLHSFLSMLGIKKIDLVTNLTGWKKEFDDCGIYINVSFDLEAREDSSKVYANMLKLQRPFNVIMLASRGLLNTPIDEVVSALNQLPKLESVEVKPYSSNQANQHEVAYTEFEEFVKALIVHPKRKFSLINEDWILDSLDGQRNSYSDDHLYITPAGKFAVLDFDLNDNEFFKSLENLDAYDAWCRQEKLKVKSNSYCSRCEYLGRCLSEHLRDVKNTEKSCNGFYKLLKWSEHHYDNQRLESLPEGL